MKISDRGILFLQDKEKLRLNAYLDLGTHGTWTIGWGHTGPDVVEGLVWTKETAAYVFAQDVARVEYALGQYVQLVLTQNQYDALVSFVYNIGVTAFRKSTMLRKLNANDLEGAAAEFPRWNKSKGKVVAGLVNRRREEQKLFNEPVKVAPWKPLSTSFWARLAAFIRAGFASWQ